MTRDTHSRFAVRDTQGRFIMKSGALSESVHDARIWHGRKVAENGLRIALKIDYSKDKPRWRTCEEIENIMKNFDIVGVRIITQSEWDLMTAGGEA